MGTESSDVRFNSLSSFCKMLQVNGDSVLLSCSGDAWARLRNRKYRTGGQAMTSFMVTISPCVVADIVSVAPARMQRCDKASSCTSRL